MIAIVLIAIAAGSASALMFASIVSGALISLLLFYLAPLPLMVAALGWGPLCATIGGIVAALGLGAIFGLPYCIAFAVTIALPAWWLGHLALLGRSMTSGVSQGNGAAAVAPDLEWYPVGRIMLWISGFAALTTMAALLTLGTDHHRRAAAGLAADPRPQRGGVNRGDRTMDRRYGDDRAGRGGHRRDDDADAQSLACRKNHGDIRTIAPSMARPEKRGSAADDARGAMRSNGILL
jgi:hypothetical protein